MKVSESTNIAMPIKNLISIIAAVAIGVWAYFGITEKLNSHSVQLELMSKDLDKAVEFSIKWPRGEMGSLPADAEQFLLIEDALKGLNAANEAGIPCIILQNNLNRNIDFSGAEIVFPSLSDFVSALAN